MKPRFRSTLHILPLVIALSSAAHAGIVNKHTAGTDLTVVGAWGTGTGPVPTSTDVATWVTGSLGGALTIGSNLSWQGIDIQAATGAITTSGAGVLTLGSSGINIASGGVNLTFNNNLTVGASQAWSIGSGRTLTINTNSSTTTFNTGTTTTLTGTGTVEFGNNRVLAGDGALVVDGATLFNNLQGGAQTRTGTTTLKSGTIKILTSVSLFGSGALNLNGGNIGSGNSGRRIITNTVNVGGNFEVGGTGLSSGAIQFSGQVDLGSVSRQITTTSILELTGTVTNAPALEKLGTGNLVLGVVDLSGTSLALSAGKLLLGGNGTATIGSLSGVAGTSIDSNYNLVSDGLRPLSVNQTTDGTYAGTISNAGGTARKISLTKAGSATLTLSGANTYDGGTTVSVGTLKVGNATAMGSGAASVTSGAVLDLNGTTMTSTGGLTLNGTGITSGGVLINSSTTAATYAGLVTLGSASSIIAGSGDITLSNTGTIAGSGYGLTVGGAKNTTIASIIGTVGGALTKQDGGTLTLSNANTYSGGTTISAGTLKIGNATAMGSGAASVTSGAVLDLNGTTMTSTGGLTLNGTGITSGGVLINSSTTAATCAGLLTLGSASSIIAGSGDITLSNTGTITGSGYGLTVGGAKNTTIAGIVGTVAGTLTKQDGGTLTLSNANTYSGGTILSSGTLRVGNNSALGTGTLRFDGGIFASDSATARTMSNALNFNTGTTITFGDATGTGTLTFGSTAALSTTGGLRTIATSVDTTFSGVISGGNTNGFTKTGAAKLILSNVGNSWINSTASENNAFIATAGTVSVTRLANANSNSSIGRTVNTATQGSITLDGATLEYIDGGAAASSTDRLVKIGRTTAGGTGTILNNATNAMETLTFSNPNAITYGTTAQTRSITIGGSNTGNNTFDSQINDNGTGVVSLTKADAGKWILSGTNTYTGATTVNSGTLLVNGSLGNTAVTVGGATATGTPALGGGGTIGGATVIVGAGGGVAGTHAPTARTSGNGQTFTSTLTYDTGSIFEWDLNAATSNTGTSNQGSYGQVIATGASGSVTGGAAVFKVVLGGNTFADAFWDTNKSWSNIFTGTGAPTSLSALFNSFDATGGLTSSGVVAGQGYFTMSSTSLTWTAVPEPTTALAGILLGAGLLRRRRA